MTTVDLNLGVMNHGQEKNHDPNTATRITMRSGFLQLYRKITRLEESKSSPFFTSLVIEGKIKNIAKGRQLYEKGKSKFQEIANLVVVFANDPHERAETP